MATRTLGPRSDYDVRPMTREERKVIVASSLGTVFEWYDFYLYGSLAIIIGAKFFTQFPEATRNIFALLAFAAGFLVRPFGALVFGLLARQAGVGGVEAALMSALVYSGTVQFIALDLWRSPPPIGPLVLTALIVSLRERLLAEHLGCKARDVRDAMARTGRLHGAIAALSRDGQRTLAAVDPKFDPALDALVPDRHVFDPERPLDPDTIVTDLVPQEEARNGARARLIGIALGALGRRPGWGPGIAAAGLAWMTMQAAISWMKALGGL